MSAEIKTMGEGKFGTSPEMFVSLLLTRIRTNQDVEGIIYAVIDKDGRVDVGNCSMEIRDLAYAARAMQLYVDDRIRNNADLGGVIDPVTGEPA